MSRETPGGARRQAGLVQHITGFSASEKTRQRALDLKVIDHACRSVAEAVQGADLVLLAVPVGAMLSSFTAMCDALAPQALLMDVGSTKRDVVDTARRVLKDQVGIFVPAHPIAGKELSGVEHADVDLYTGRQVILTPIERTMTVQLERAQKLWTALDCEVKLMSPEAHDAAFAAVSHLPHMISFALMNAIKGQEQAEDFLALAGPGFRDFSRIAASDPQMWRDVLMSNREEILAQSKQFQRALHALELALSNGEADKLETLIDEASRARARWRMGNKLKG